MIKKFLLLFLLFQSPLGASSQEALNEAQKLYKSGKLPEAVALLENIYSKDKTDTKTKNLLVKALTELGIDLSFKERYDGAIMAFRRAHDLSPDDETINDLLGTVQELTAPPEEEKQKPVKIEPPKIEEKKAPEPEKIKSERPKTVPTVYIGDSIKLQNELIKKMEVLAETFRKNVAEREKRDEDTLKKLDRLINTGDAANKILSTALGHTEKTFKKTFALYLSAFLAASAVILIILFLMLRSAALRRERFLAPGGAGQIANKPAAKRIAFDETQTPGKFDGIEIIEAELSSEDNTEKNVARTLLEPFLNDDDIETRVRAVSTLYKYDKDETEKIITGFARSGDNSEIKAFCRLISFIPVETGLSIIEELYENADSEIKEHCLKAISDINASQISEEVRERLEKITRDLKKNGWVIE